MLVVISGNRHSGAHSAGFSGYLDITCMTCVSLDAILNSYPCVHTFPFANMDVPRAGYLAKCLWIFVDHRTGAHLGGASLGDYVSRIAGDIRLAHSLPVLSSISSRIQLKGLVSSEPQGA
ncbi:uncharacterized protein PG998_004640 [Apiospora kogelbergensis]|uniref:uncharacterized protein n=1 Tax=Apiospora kogelbergensis TaxID=1337665 RepID=UPI00313130DF